MTEESDDPKRGERIAKWLARAGVASRRDAEKMIAEGRVKLGGKVVETPATFITPGDHVMVEVAGDGGSLVFRPAEAPVLEPETV